MRYLNDFHDNMLAFSLQKSKSKMQKEFWAVKNKQGSLPRRRNKTEARPEWAFGTAGGV